MKAAWYSVQGNADQVLQVGSVSLPVLKSDEVLVKIYASGINPSDVKKRMGNRGVMEYSKIIPHSDGAGIITAVGSSVSTARIGQRVWVYNAQHQRPFGTAAQYVALNEHLAQHLPDNTDFAVGACLGIPAFTAHRAVFADGEVRDKVILVTGGAGSVGNLAIQMAKWGGARVITTVSNDEKAQVARNAGADFVFNYRTEDVAKCVMSLTGGVDRVIEVDFGHNLTINAEILNTNGVIATYASMGEPNPILPFYPWLLKSVTLRLIYVYDLPEVARLQAIQDILVMLEQQRLNVVIGARFALDDIIAAQQLVESSNVLGNIILDID